jgi:damage-control phosphatase, subfamily I
MNPRQECEPCLWRQAQEAIALTASSEASGVEVLRQVRQWMDQADWQLPAPVLGQTLHRLIRQLTHHPDPYAAIKRQLNQLAADLYPIWHRRFREKFPPLEAAVRLAIVGNLLDVAAKTQLDNLQMETALTEALTAPLCGSVATLATALRGARSILYLADNAGEIVFDRDLLAQLPLGSFTLAVRGRPVLNDATLTDAYATGLADYADVISNGSDAPGTILKDCSAEFRTLFNAADLIIAKGQGNYETLAGTDQRIFFLLKIKCDVLSRALGWRRGSLVLHHQRSAASKTTVGA